MKVTILGCGGSLGVPMVGHGWGDCDPANPRNRRLRPAILIEHQGTIVLVDTTPDCRAQLLAAGVDRLDAVLYTHAHADHLHGVDDLRPLLFDADRPIPAYADANTIRDLEQRFGYAIAGVPYERGFYRPILAARPIEGPFTVGAIDVVPFVQDHGWSSSLGFRFGDIAYSTDVAMLDEAAFEALQGVGVWIVDACREAPHPSHAHLARTLEWIARLRPRRAILTHMNHTMDYERVRAMLPAGVEPGYDGLVIEG